VPAVVGPFTGWQRAFGTVYSAGAGSINLTTGAFTRTGVAWNQVVWYGTDAAINATLRITPVIPLDSDSPALGSTSLGSPSGENPVGNGDQLAGQFGLAVPIIVDPGAPVLWPDPGELTPAEINAQQCFLPQYR